MLYSRTISRSLLSTSTIDRSLAGFFGRFQRDLSRGARAVRGGAGRILWVEQPWNVHPRKLDREIFEDGPSAKIGSLENFRPYGNSKGVASYPGSRGRGKESLVSVACACA